MKNNHRFRTEVDSHSLPDKDRQSVNQNDASLQEVLSSLNGIQLTQRQEEQFAFLLNEHRGEMEGQAASTRYLVLLLILSFVLPAGSMSCTHFKRAFGRKQPQQRITEVQALEARANGNYLVAREYFDKQFCESTRLQIEQCGESEKAPNCDQIIQNTETCDDVEEKIGGMIDYLVKEAKRHAEKDMYRDAISFTDQAIDALDNGNDTEMRAELSANRTEYLNQIEAIREAYSKKHEELDAWLAQQEPFDEKTWEAIQNLLESMRVDRNETRADDADLFKKTFELASRFYREGDFKRAKKVIEMAENVDLGQAGYHVETQITTGFNALKVAINIEIKEEDDEHTQEVHKFIYAIEEDFKIVWLKLKGKAKRRAGGKIWSRIKQARKMKPTYGQTQRLKKMERVIARWYPTKSDIEPVPEPVVTPVDTPQPPAPPPTIAQQPSLKVKWDQEKWDAADQMWRDQNRDGIAAYKEILTWGDLPSGKRSLAEKRFKRLKRAFGVK